MSGNYRIALVIFEDGERFPMLVDRGSGVPLFYPTIYSITVLRARNLASSTIVHALRAIILFHAFLSKYGINLEDRRGNGTYLALNEIDCLAREVRFPIARLLEGSDVGAAEVKRLRPALFGSRERHRQRITSERQEETELGFAAARLRYIRDYISWLTAQHLARIDRDEAGYAAKEAKRQQMLEAINTRIPPIRARRMLSAREGLASNVVEKLLQVVDDSAPENPWEGEYTRRRNQLIVLWSLELGLRRGELMGVCIDDIDFRKQEVLIRRRSDDSKDPRRYQPNAKTKDRRLPLSNELIQLTQSFIMEVRIKIVGARKHAFLFVAEKSGRPLSTAAMSKIYTSLREKCPDIPDDLTWHAFRHTWNDRFSETMESRNVPPEQEQKMRSYLMGWSERSGAAAIYTRRYVRKPAHKASLELQSSLIGKSDNGKKK
jgi:integrase